MADVTGVILAGGKSRRMGEDKRFLTVGAASLLERCRSAMMSAFREVLIVTAQDSPPLEGDGCRVFQDLIPDCGSLGGLYTGLKMATSGRIFIVACDMPFLNQPMIRFFINRDPEADVVIGRLSTGLQPLHAVYGKGALTDIEQMVHARQLRIQEVVSRPSLKITIIDESEWRHIDPASRVFRNVNTPADLLMARDEASRSSLVQ